MTILIKSGLESRNDKGQNNYFYKQNGQGYVQPLKKLNIPAHETIFRNKSLFNCWRGNKFFG